MRRILPEDDVRVHSAPIDQYKEQRNFRLSDHRYQQLNQEVQYTKLSRQDVIDTALREYFAKRYKS